MPDDNHDIRAALRDAADEWEAEDALRDRIRRGDTARTAPSRRTWPAAAAAAAVVAVIAAATFAFAADRSNDRDGTVVADDTSGMVDSKEWRRLPAAPIEGRAFPAAVWTGDEMIVWGGTSLDGQVSYDDGARYDPATDTWTPIAASPVDGRYTVTAWTGTEMLLWGRVSGPLNYAAPGGAAYDPAADSWRLLPDGPVPSRPYAAGAWTGRELVVWGGYDVAPDGTVSGADDGAVYDPAANTWRPVAPGPLEGRFYHGVAWTGTEVVVWGGAVGDGAEGTTFSDGAAYDPAADRWRPVSPSPLTGRSDPVMSWTGNGVMVWGGVDGGANDVADGAVYVPATDGWDRLPVPSAADGRRFLFGGSAWTGDRLAMLSSDGGTPLAALLLGGPAAGEPSSPSPVAGRRHPAVVWTGTELIVWGGETPNGPSDDGVRWRHTPPPCPNGPPTVIVPDLVGLTVADARAAADAAGVRVAEGGGPDLDDAPADATVSGHEPPAGAAVSPGACVGLRVERLVAPPPGPGEPLADGVHAVHVTDIDDSTVTVDVVQWLEGPEADEAYAEDTGDTSGAPNDHHVRNASTELRTLPVNATTVSVAWRDTGPFQHDIPVGTFGDYLARRNDPASPYWITVRDGQVTRIVEQYRP